MDRAGSSRTRLHVRQPQLGSWQAGRHSDRQGHQLHTSASTHLYWGRGWYVWNNTGDKVACDGRTALLRTPVPSAAPAASSTAESVRTGAHAWPTNGSLLMVTGLHPKQAIVIGGCILGVVILVMAAILGAASSARAASQARSTITVTATATKTVRVRVTKKPKPAPTKTVTVTAQPKSRSAGTEHSSDARASLNCTPGYSPRLPPAYDYYCSGGSGDGPKYTGPVRVHWLRSLRARQRSRRKGMRMVVIRLRILVDGPLSALCGELVD